MTRSTDSLGHTQIERHADAIVTILNWDQPREHLVDAVATYLRSYRDEVREQTVIDVCTRLGVMPDPTLFTSDGEKK